MHKRTSGVCIVACAFAILGGCARHRAEAAGKTQYAPAPATGSVSGGEQGAPLSDAEVAKVLEAANRGEVKEAEVAFQRTQDPEVRAFAERMIRDHGRALERATELEQRTGAQARASSVEEQLSTDIERSMDDLESVGSALFDRTYMDAQVTTHRKILGLIDRVLLPSAQDPALRAEIAAVRPMIASHLEQAERIQSGMR